MTDSYIGVPPKSGFINTAKQRVTSSTNNYVDLDHAISDLSDVIVWVNSVKQDSTNLTLTNPSKITLGGTLTASDVVEIVYLGKQVATQSPDTGSVTNSMLAGSIANDKLAGSIGLDKLSATGTKSSSTFLRGDNTFAEAGGNTGGVYWGATMTTDRTVPHNTATLMHFNDEYYDSGSVYDPSTYKATIPSGGAGFYLVGYSFNIQHPSDNSRVQNPHAWLYKNGSGVYAGSGAYGGQFNFRLDNSNYSHRECNVQNTFIIQLADSDYLQVYAYNSMDNNTNANGRAEYSSFWGIRMT